MIIDELIAILGFKVEGEDRLKRFNKGLNDVSAAAGRMAQSVGNAATLIGGALTVGFGLLGRSVINTGSTFESLRTQLTALEGSAEKAEESLAWIKKFGQETPLSMTEAARAFAMMRNFGLDPTNGSLQAIVDNAALMNKGIDSVMGIILPLGQAWSAQKLQGQDMMQLVNQGIPAWELLSEAMGKTVAEVREMSSKGKIGRAEMSKFFEVLAKRGYGASALMAKTWTGVMARMGDAWEDFNLRISEAGIFESAKSRAEELLAVFQRWQKDGTMDRVAKKISNAMESISRVVLRVIERVAHHIKFLNDNWEQLSWYVNAAGIAMAALIAKANPVITAFLILGLVIEDFITYLQGGESVIGGFIDSLKEMLGVPEAVAQVIVGLGAAIAGLFLLFPKAAIKGAASGGYAIGKAMSDGISKSIQDHDYTKAGTSIGEKLKLGIMGVGIAAQLYNIISDIPTTKEGIEKFASQRQESTAGFEKWWMDKVGTPRTWLGLDQPMQNFQGNMERVGANGAAAAIPSTLNDSRDQSQTVNVTVGGVTVQGVQNVTPAVGAAVGQAVGNSAAGAVPPSRVINQGSAF